VVGGVGELVPIQDPKKLAYEIERLLLSPKKLAEMRQRGLERVKTFSWENLLPKYESFYQKVALTAQASFPSRFADLVVHLFKDGFKILNQVFFRGVVFNIGRRKKKFRSGGQAGNQETSQKT
jgi:hypothetical protein